MCEHGSTGCSGQDAAYLLCEQGIGFETGNHTIIKTALLLNGVPIDEQITMSLLFELSQKLSPT